MTADHQLAVSMALRQQQAPRVEVFPCYSEIEDGSPTKEDIREGMTGVLGD